MVIFNLSGYYDNKITLKVGGKQVASGELVIINDRFGVRIENVNESNSSPVQTQSQVENSSESEENSSEEDFDYSDFEVEQG